MNWRVAVLKALKSAISGEIQPKQGLSDKEKALFKASFKWLSAAESLEKLWLKKAINKQDFTLCFAMALAELEDLHAENEHATLFETVELLKQNKKTAHLASTLNALLRKYLNDKPQNLPKIPKWIFTKISKQYTDAKNITDHMLDQAAIDLRLRGSVDIEGEKRANGALRIAAQDITKLVGFDEGLFYAQDEAAQLPGFVLEQIIKDHPIKNIVDICCAPGGKLFHFMDVAPKADVLGIDLNPKRLERVSENAKRLKLKAQVEQKDMREVSGSYDFVSLDVPCSATGTSRRHPEVLFRQTALEVKKLTDLQREGLNKVSLNVAKGGFLLYSTCSIFKDESEHQIEKFLESHPDFELVDLNQYSALKPYTNDLGQIRTTPDMSCDGFFVALLRKTVS